VVAPQVLPPDALVGRTLKHYRVDEFLNRGGMGVVYRAWDEKLKRTVALKTIRPEVATNPTALARLEREARAAAALSHPAIATLYDFDVAGDVHFLVFEYLEGVSLRDHARARRLAAAEVVAIAGALARALGAAHKAGILHRDVKPENVMILEGGTVKMLDFGLAKLGPGIDVEWNPATAVNLTSAGAVIGTLNYMSPEQLAGTEIDPRSDLFALGTVLYELMAGEHPFAADSAAETIARIMRAEPPPLHQRNPGVSPEFARIVERCLRREPRERYASASDLARDLSALEVGGTPGLASGSAGPVEPDYILPRQLARILFATFQLVYLAMYLVALAKSSGLRDGLASAFGLDPLGRSAETLLGAILAVAMIGIAVRLYLLSLVGWDHVQTGVRHARAFPFFFVLDAVWALTPLAMIEPWGMLALAAVVPLAYAPISQRTLLRSAYDPALPRRVSASR
jgi:hypothetical protein